MGPHKHVLHIAHRAHLTEAADHHDAAHDAGLQCATAALIQQVHLIDANQGNLRQRSQLHVNVWTGSCSTSQHEQGRASPKNCMPPWSLCLRVTASALSVDINRFLAGLCRLSHACKKLQRAPNFSGVEQMMSVSASAATSAMSESPASRGTSQKT